MSVDVRQLEPCFGIGYSLALICRPTSVDMKLYIISGVGSKEVGDEGTACSLGWLNMQFATLTQSVTVTCTTCSLGWLSMQSPLGMLPDAGMTVKGDRHKVTGVKLIGSSQPREILRWVSTLPNCLLALGTY